MLIYWMGWSPCVGEGGKAASHRLDRRPPPRSIATYALGAHTGWQVPETCGSAVVKVARLVRLSKAIKERAERAGVDGFHLHLTRPPRDPWLRPSGSEGGLIAVARGQPIGPTVT
jgi:hypothetical protein